MEKRKKSAKNTPEMIGNIFWRIVHIKEEVIKIYVALIIFAILMAFFGANPVGDFATYIALAPLLSELLVSLLLPYAQSYLYEKTTKLTKNYQAIVDKYESVNLIERNGIRLPGERIAFRKEADAPFQFKFDYGGIERRYCIPEQVVEKSEELIRAYASEFVYNSHTVRLEKCAQRGETVSLGYSMANYYDLLLTNRSMDYPLSLRGLHTVTSIRELYEPGPFLSPLSQSKLANHLGFNGFVAVREEEEQKIVFVKRDKKVSIGKNVWGPSVSASYKVQHGLDENRKMSADTIGRAIRKAVECELEIPENILNDDFLSKTVFAFYRDVVEGGKPHFVFYLDLWNPNLKLSESDLKKLEPTQFAKRFKENKKAKNKKLDIAFFTPKQLLESEIHSDKLIPKGEKPLEMQPFGTISLTLLLDYLAKDKQR